MRSCVCWRQNLHCVSGAVQWGDEPEVPSSECAVESGKMALKEVCFMRPAFWLQKRALSVMFTSLGNKSLKRFAARSRNKILNFSELSFDVSEAKRGLEASGPIYFSKLRHPRIFLQERPQESSFPGQGPSWIHKIPNLLYMRPVVRVGVSYTTSLLFRNVDQNFTASVVESLLNVGHPARITRGDVPD